jgi:hypothetical protein
MFKGFQGKSRQFNGFPNLNFQANNEAYGFSGCTFWLDAAYGLNTQTDLAAVSSWIDKISGISFNQTTAANQPRFILSTSSLNNLPSVEFQTSSARFMTSNNIVGINNILTIFVVYKINLLNNYNILAFNSSSFTPGSLQLANNSSVNNGFGIYDGSNANTKVIGDTVKDTNAHIAILTNNTITKDGNLVATTNWFPKFGINILGQNSATNSVQSYIAEFGIYNKELDTTQIAQLSSRINSKYAIY